METSGYSPLNMNYTNNANTITVSNGGTGIYLIEFFVQGTCSTSDPIIVDVTVGGAVVATTVYAGNTSTLALGGTIPAGLTLTGTFVQTVCGRAIVSVNMGQAIGLVNKSAGASDSIILAAVTDHSGNSVINASLTVLQLA